MWAYIVQLNNFSQSVCRHLCLVDATISQLLSLVNIREKWRMGASGFEIAAGCRKNLPANKKTADSSRGKFSDKIFFTKAG